mmetsp:Transcript_11070/g.12672  ORF Transcript_11070/g.12672 Transcript_11070/m.12672 type:complete len:158 (-) Transcript_11070:432-905(-)
MKKESILLTLLASVFIAVADDCFWPKRLQCKKLDAYVGSGGNCIVDLKDKSKRCTRKVAGTVCKNAGVSGKKCLRQCQNFHKKCCCSPKSTAPSPTSSGSFAPSTGFPTIEPRDDNDSFKKACKGYYDEVDDNSDCLSEECQMWDEICRFDGFVKNR